MTATAPTDEPAHQKPRKSTPKLRDGVMKRGNTWSYVIRVKDSRDRDQQAEVGWRLRHRGRSQGRP
jgi:hypothetical protein